MFWFKKIKQKDIESIIKLILSKKLYIEGYMAKKLFVFPEIILKLGIVYESDASNIIGWCAVYDYNKFVTLVNDATMIRWFDDDYRVMIYIDTHYRRKGLGRLLIKKMRLESFISHDEGIDGSNEFWKKVRFKNTKEFWEAQIERLKQELLVSNVDVNQIENNS